MNKRLSIIYSELLPCRKFADVGCDHGYIAKAMLISGKAERVVISDISEPSLRKAENLLGADSRVRAVVCDGLKDVDADCDQVLIAGMGGEEIINILLSAPFLPERLVLQPMKNADKVRKRLLLLGYSIKKDYIFKCGKFYALIVCERGNDSYTEDELFFGRDNLKGQSEDFLEYARLEYEKYGKLLSGKGLSESVYNELLEIKNRYGEVLNIK